MVASAQPIPAFPADLAFPPLPAAALQILQLSEKPGAALDDLSEVIASDKALGETLLRAINSNFYAAGRKVSTVRQAVAMLGLQSVQTLALGIALAATVHTKAREASLQTYWRRCVFSAAAARALSLRFLPAAVESCFVAALLMDLGTLVLEEAAPDRHAVLSRRAASHADLAALERAGLPLDHAEVSAMLIHHWGLPASLETPVRSHHNPAGVANPRLRAVAEILEIAGRCAEIYVGQHTADAISDARAGLTTMMGCAPAEADKLLARIGQKASELAPLLGVKPGCCDYSALLDKATPRLVEIALDRRQAKESNQRKAQRLARDGMLCLSPCTGGALGREVRVGLRDLSSCGIGIAHTRPMAPGSQFVITLPQPGAASKSLLYTAVRCEGAGNMFHIGAELRAVLCPGSHALASVEENDDAACGAD